MHMFFQFHNTFLWKWILYTNTQKYFVKEKNPNNNFLIKKSWDRNLSHLYFGDFEKIPPFFIQVWIYLVKDIIKYSFH